jgi:UDP:flavonoid glycosyltransferase YjiC (YdhE family)
MSLRVLLATEACEGLGHVVPWHSLLETLSTHGHAVTMACPQAVLAKPLLEDTGATVLQAWWPSMHAGAINEPSYCWEDLLWNLGYGNGKAVAACAKHWTKILATERPDVMVADYAPLAMAMAKAAGIPVIEAGCGFCVPAVLLGYPIWLPHIRQLNPSLELHQKTLVRMQTRGRSIAQAFDQALPMDARMAQFCAIYQSASVRCVTSSRDLDHYANWRGANDVAYLGALKFSSLGADPHMSVPAWSSADVDSLKLLCYLKEGIYNIDAYLAQLVSSTGWQILIAGLSSSKIKQLRTANAALPSHIHISDQALDFSKAIPWADAFLTNGGIHSLSYALSHSKPCLLVPSQAEQASTALLLKDNVGVRVVGRASHLQSHLLALREAGRKTRSDSAIAPKKLMQAEAGLLSMLQKLASQHEEN